MRYILLLFLLPTTTVGQIVVQYPQGDHTADILAPNISASVIAPNNGINEVACGTYISAENFDQSSWQDALTNGGYWEFTLTPDSGYEFNLTKLTVLRVASDRTDPEELEKRAYLYKIGTDPWIFLASYNTTNLGDNLCVNSSSGTVLNTNITTTEAITFALVYYGNNTTDPAQTRFGQITVEGGSTLPVQFIDFNGRRNSEEIFLSWTTGSEVYNDGFELQKFVDGSDWRAFGFVKGKGTSNISNTYHFNDTDPVSGINYYRIKQIDDDGAYVYSDVIAVEFYPVKRDVLIFPNPSNGVFNLQTDNSSSEKVVIHVTDYLGRTVWWKEWTENNTFFMKEIEIKEKGTYIVVVQMGDEIHVEKVVVLDK